VAQTTDFDIVTGRDPVSDQLGEPRITPSQKSSHALESKSLGESSNKSDEHRANSGASARPDKPHSFEAVLKEERKAYSSASPPMPSTPGPVGLALSGGGIRSATFSLGVLQALARAEKLASFDYLSTVSGGGYIGGWLSAWIHRSSLQHVQCELGRCGSAAAQDRGMKADEAEPVSWLRRYSNYLTPRVGVFSTDSITLIAIWLRNVLLSLIIVVAFISALLLCPRVLLLFIETFLEHRGAFSAAAAFLGIVAFPVAITAHLLHMARRSNQARFWMASARGVMLTVLMPAVLAAFCASIWLFGTSPFPLTRWDGLAIGCLLLLCVPLILWLAFNLWHHQPVILLTKEACVFALATSVSIAVAAALLGVLQHQFPFNGLPADHVALLTFGPPAVLMTFGISGSIYVGLVGRVFYERSREWWSRMNAWFFGIGFWWLVLMCVALYIPAIMHWAHASLGVWSKSLVSAGWLGSLVATLLARKLERLPRGAQPAILRLLNAAVFLVLTGLIISISVGIDTVMGTLTPQAQQDLCAGCDRHQLVPYIERATTNLSFSGKADLFDTSWPLPTALLFLAGVVLVLFGWRVDVNKFSLHNMYKNRLIRCYLGATNTKRNAYRFMGFDESDDVPLKDLLVQRPFHIFNTALNLSQGKNLAWQERKAASFFLTPVYCGYALAKTQGDTTESTPAHNLAGDALPAFCSTAKYARDDTEEPGFTIGMAMATSGAAASPNMGVNTSPSLAFLMTVLNIRLGRWSPNTAKALWTRPSPRFGLLRLLQELFGLSNEESNFVYLSDGGHFDNMGIYELVRRRCSVIWLVDATADPGRGFSDLGKAIRQCRIDFGVEIDLPLDALRAPGPDLLPEAGYVVGTIRYEQGNANPASCGKIIYMKPTMCQDAAEPSDVQAYATRNASFPHQSTGDQFFEESQFESYRRLGIHIADACIDAHGDSLPATTASDKGPAQDNTGMRVPHSARWWFACLLFITVVFGALLGVYQAHYMPYVPHEFGAADGFNVLMASKRDETLVGYECNASVLMEMQRSNAHECKGKNVKDAPAPTAFELALASWARGLHAEPPTAPQIWLWLENFWILAYSATFIYGFMALRHSTYPDRNRQPRAVVTLMWAAVGLVAFGAVADYLENFLLLGSLNAGSMIAQAAHEVRGITAAKFFLFDLNLLILIGVSVVVLVLKRRRSRHRVIMQRK
jgi:hypothetical protein